MFAEPKKKPASKGEMWFAEFQPQYHKADYRILNLHLRENSLRNMTAAFHSFIQSFNKYVAKYCAKYFSGAWHQSVKNFRPRSLPSWGQKGQITYREEMTQMTACFS